MIQSRHFILQAFVAILLCICTGPSRGAQPMDGYFTGVDLEPLGTAGIATVEKEPAVVLVFAVDQKTAQATSEFNAWYATATDPKLTVFAIAVAPEGLSHDVAVEAINQRDLKVPVYLARADLLLGDELRLSVLNDDQEVERYTTMDLTGVNAALAKLGVTVTGPPPAPAAAAATPAVAVAPTAPAVTPAAPPAVAVAPAATPPLPVPTPDEEPRILGGPDGDPVYRNELYGFTVMFPPRWSYKVAAKDDGAVAIPPTASPLDMRAYGVFDDSVDSPQQYIDTTLDALAKKYATRITIDRRVEVRTPGMEGVDISYTYARPLHAENPALGSLRYRGRMLVYVQDGTVKAAMVEGSTGPFMASMPIIDSFFRSFQAFPVDNAPPSGYNSPTI